MCSCSCGGAAHRAASEVRDKVQAGASQGERADDAVQVLGLLRGQLGDRREDVLGQAGDCVVVDLAGLDISWKSEFSSMLRKTRKEATLPSFRPSPPQLGKSPSQKGIALFKLESSSTNVLLRVFPASSLQLYYRLI